MLIGEQPGDQEDIAGKPFVGPTGRLLHECLEEAGVGRSLCYVTNAVKHFKFERRGKRRLHARPNAGEIQRCAWWLGGELELLRPDLIVALGATALYVLMGRSVGLTKERGHVLPAASGTPVLVTIHPSYLLRIRDHDDRESERRRFVGDLKSIRDHLDAGRSVDLLLANAGRGLGKGFLEQDFAEARRVIDTNVVGTVYLIQQIGNQMRPRGAGKILITGSIAGFIPGSYQAVYNGSKAFLNSFSFALRNELQDTGVTVTCLMPGPTDTPRRTIRPTSPRSASMP